MVDVRSYISNGAERKSCREAKVFVPTLPPLNWARYSNCVRVRYFHAQESPRVLSKTLKEHIIAIQGWVYLFLSQGARPTNYRHNILEIGDTRVVVDWFELHRLDIQTWMYYEGVEYCMVFDCKELMWYRLELEDFYESIHERELGVERWYEELAPRTHPLVSPHYCNYCEYIGCCRSQYALA